MNRSPRIQRTERERFLYSRRPLMSDAHKPYDEAELLLMYEPYIRERDVNELSIREVRLLSTLLDVLSSLETNDD